MIHADYAAITAVNWSTLKAMDESPALYRWLLKHPREDTPLMAFGRLAHVALLQPEELPLLYAVWDGPKRGNDYKRFEQDAAIGGLEVVTVSDYERALAVRDAVRRHPQARRLLRGHKTEVTVTWRDTVNGTGLRCKGRIDYLGRKHFLDFKTTADVEERKWVSTWARLYYDAQMMFYNQGLEANGLKREPYIIAARRDPPHEVRVDHVGEDWQFLGNEVVARLLKRLKECQTTRRWPERYADIQQTEPPEWRFAQADMEGDFS